MYVCVCNGKCYWLVLTVVSYNLLCFPLVFLVLMFFRCRNLSKYVVCEICISFSLGGDIFGLSYNKMFI